MTLAAFGLDDFREHHRCGPRRPHSPRMPLYVCLAGWYGRKVAVKVLKCTPKLVVCTTVTKKTTKNGRKVAVEVLTCTTRRSSGTVKFTITSDELEANVSRAGVTYATGRAIPTGTDQRQLVLTRQIHPLRPGRYILTLRSPHGRSRILERRLITIS
jgi:hypothetical protein